MPTIDRARFTDAYGTPRGPQGQYPHAGIDIGGITPGTTPNILAAKSGTVQFVGWDLVSGRNGQHIGIRHEGGDLTFYGHISSPTVSQGQRVSRGQHIATMSNTGTSAIHLHFEHWTNANNSESHHDPTNWLAQNGWVFRNESGTRRLYNTGGDWLDMVTENELRQIIREETATARWSYKGNDSRDAWAYLRTGSDAAVAAQEQAVRNKNALEPIVVNRGGEQSSHPLKTILSGLDAVTRETRSRVQAIEAALKGN